MSSEKISDKAQKILEIRDQHAQTLRREIEQLRETSKYIKENISKITHDRVLKESLKPSPTLKRGAVSEPKLQHDWIEREIAEMQARASDLERNFDRIVRCRTLVFVCRGRDIDRLKSLLLILSDR